MRIRAAAAAVLVVPLFVACGQPISPTGPTSSGTAGLFTVTAVPFKGRFEGLLTTSAPAPPLLPSSIEATGNATHLGLFTLEIPHIVNTATRIGTGRFEFRAADGDMLIADFVGQATVIAPGVLSTVDSATITGGTGRFVNATGSFAGSRTFVLATGAVTGSFAGTIDTVRGNEPRDERESR